MELLEQHVLMSIKPEYANKILSGEKSVELRRFFPADIAENSLLFIYSSSPDKAIIGFVRIKNVHKLPVMDIWRKYRDQACIDYKKFRSYFSGKKEGYVLSVSQPTKFERPIEREEIESRHRFYPPQSYKYLTQDLYDLINESSDVFA
ncbi:MAG: ASCH domain-containing protein [Pseudomonadales bacterium]|nr:ASCH domain-containing protein [Pseudomonadales bacterium]